MEGHVDVFIEAPPIHSPSELVQIVKSISAREIYEKSWKIRKPMRSPEKG